MNISGWVAACPDWLKGCTVPVYMDFVVPLGAVVVACCALNFWLICTNPHCPGEVRLVQKRALRIFCLVFLH